jgi:D-alanyl-D-alanine carboxypeptidase (penicillin-binding protein 5/6)
MRKTGEESAVRSPETGKRRQRKDHGFAVRRGIALHSLFALIGFVLLTFRPPLLTSAWAGVEEIQSKAAVVMDATTGRVLYAKNPDLRLLPASTTKLMTALVVMERAKLSDVTTVSKRAAGQPASRVGLKAGEKFTLENLLYGALMKSGNDAAVALAEAVGGTEEQFVELMNQKAIAIGAYDTHFVNANGLPEPGQYITAYDLAKIMRQAIKYPVLQAILGTRVTDVSTEAGKQIRVRNTNKLLWSDDDVLGGKTGYTRQARHCFVCAGERDNGTIIVALLGEPYRDLLWKDSEKLMAFGEKVLDKTEEPVIYLSKNQYSTATAHTVSYTEGREPAAGGERRYSRKAKRSRRALAKHKKRHKKHRKAARALAKHEEEGGKVAEKKADTGQSGVSRHRVKKRKTKKMIAKKENGDQG